jgi:glycosyltransferase involved in cell wall biosynthesis
VHIVLTCDAPSEHLFPLPAAWAARGHRVDIVMDRDRGRFGTADGFRDLGLEFHAFDSTRPGATAIAADPGRLRRLVGTADAVVIGGYATRTARTVLAIPREQRPTTVLLAERPDPRTTGVRRRLRDAWIRIAVRRVDAVWPMSEVGRAAFARLGGVPTVLAPYPLRDPAGEPLARVSLGPLHIAVVGTLTPRKRPMLAAETVRRLAAQRDLVATFVGTGPLHSTLLAATRDLPVRMVDQMSRQQVDELLGVAHVLLHPSAHDGWGMVVIEAVARGAAVVSTGACDAAVELAAVTPTVHVVDGNAASLADAVMRAADGLTRGGEQAAARALAAATAIVGVDVVAERTLADLGRLADR